MKRIGPMSLVFAALLVGCGPEDSDTAPVLDGLAFTPTVLTAGQVVRVSGTFNFTDPDGDIVEFWVAVNPPVGDVGIIGPREAQGAGGKTSGEMSFQVELDPRLPGDYLLQIWVVDAAGNASNLLRATLPAQ